jgi:hypothetical protein
LLYLFLLHPFRFVLLNLIFVQLSVWTVSLPREISD